MFNVLLNSNAVPTTKSDSLRVVGSNSTVNSSDLLIRFDLLRDDGEIVRSFETFNIASGSTSSPFLFSLTKGSLIGIAIAILDTEIQDGEVFATVAIQNGQADNIRNRIAVTSGYASTNAPLIWPGTPARGANDTPGVSQTLALTGPAAGAEYNQTLLPTAFSKLIAGNFTFTADANVATRTITVKIADSLSEVFWTTPNATITAGQTRTIFLINEPVPSTIPPGVLYAPIHNMPHVPSLRFYTTTVNRQIGDQFSGGFLNVNRFTLTS